MDRATLAALWDAAWTDGLWAASWSRAVDGLTPEQAAWKPGQGRNSIWQHVNHVVFWREVTLRRLAGGAGPTEEETRRGNFAEPGEVSGAGWRAARERFADSHRRIAAAIADERNALERPLHHIPHDAYHVGQIMLLRALQGLPPIE